MLQLHQAATYYKILCYKISLIGLITSLRVSESFAHNILTAWKGFPGHPCDRPCLSDTQPMVCYYKMNVETYATMSKACFNCPFTEADCERPHCVPGAGFNRLIYTINRQLPSPQIRVSASSPYSSPTTALSTHVQSYPLV